MWPVYYLAVRSIYNISKIEKEKEKKSKHSLLAIYKTAGLEDISFSKKRQGTFKVPVIVLSLVTLMGWRENKPLVSGAEPKGCASTETNGVYIRS